MEKDRNPDMVVYDGFVGGLVEEEVDRLPFLFPGDGNGPVDLLLMDLFILFICYCYIHSPIESYIR